MESAVVAIDHEGDSLSVDPNLTVQEAEAGPGTRGPSVSIVVTGEVWPPTGLATPAGALAVRR